MMENCLRWIFLSRMCWHLVRCPATYVAQTENTAQPGEVPCIHVGNYQIVDDEPTDGSCGRPRPHLTAWPQPCATEFWAPSTHAASSPRAMPALLAIAQCSLTQASYLTGPAVVAGDAGPPTMNDNPSIRELVRFLKPPFILSISIRP